MAYMDADGSEPPVVKRPGRGRRRAGRPGGLDRPPDRLHLFDAEGRRLAA